ncbi:hypothetical protein R3P38DRAFT_3391214 [Favolaschia claudopus]|uniref:Uncharacterized protein n=1 Tax=Favolaschia claudopus TaxID=2862362 RepID=A0AAW0CLT6_9AGAR
MAPPYKSTPEEREFLLAYLPDFIKRQAEGKLALFWSVFWKAWFAKFSEHAGLGLPVPGSKDARPLTEAENKLVGEAISTKKAKIVNWFRNNRAKLVSATNGAADTAMAGLLNRILKLGPQKKQRAHQAIEVFQKRNPELIKAALVDAGYDLLNKTGDDDEEDDWTDESDDSPAARLKMNKSDRVRLRTRVVHALWKEVSPEEREAVMEDLAAEKAKAHEKAAAAGAQEGTESPGTPTERQEGIDALETLVAAVHKVIYQATGWVGMTIVGGPNPRLNGELTLKVICFGETPEGNDFEACYPEFNANVLQAFQDFIRLCFSEDDCSFAAMPTTLPSVSDGRAVHRVNPETTEAPTPAPAKKKSKSKSKSTASKSKSKPKKAASNTPNTQDNTNAASPPSVDAPAPDLPAEGDVSPPPPSLSSAFRDGGSDMEEDWITHRDDDDMLPFNDFDDVPGPTAHAWPAGMTAPLSPEAANAIGTIERGGTANLATMAIDPQLLDLDPPPLASPSHSPPPTSTSSYPRPKAAYRPTAVTPAPSQPRQTWAARHMLSIIADTDKEKTTPNSSSPLPPHNTTFPPITPGSPASTAAPATVPAAPAESPSTSAPLPVIPRSRPAVQTPTAKKTSIASAPEKEAAAAQAAKVSNVEERVKKARGRPRKSPLTDITNQLIDNAEPTPSSPPSSSTTPAALPATSPPSMNIPSTSTTPDPAAPPSADIPEIPRGNVNICVDPGRYGNRYHAKLAAEKEKIEKAAAAAAAKKGWVQREVAGATVVTFNGPATSTSATDPPARTSARGRPLKTAKRPDGTDVQAVTKGTRKGVAGEVSAPAAGKKRKAASAPTTTKPSGKR